MKQTKKQNPLLLLKLSDKELFNFKVLLNQELINTTLVDIEIAKLSIPDLTIGELRELNLAEHNIKTSERYRLTKLALTQVLN